MNEKKVEDRLNSIENRLSNIEESLNLSYENKEENISNEEKKFGNNDSSISALNDTKHERFKSNNIEESNFTFNQVITFLGVAGIITGIVSFFFYAIANNWIGKGTQVGIGVIVGFLMFATAIYLKNKKEDWSNIVLGGSYFVEYLSIVVGVHTYKIIPEILGVLIASVFLVSSLILAIKYSSRVIAYFSLLGGYLIPFVSGMYVSDVFLMSFYLVLSLGLILLSFNKFWPDLRFTSFLVISLTLISYSAKFYTSQTVLIPFLFLVSIFLIYNLSSLIGSIRHSEDISQLDTMILTVLPVLILPLLNILLKWSTEGFGVLLMIFSFLYLFEIMYLKFSKVKVHQSALYTLFAGGIITLNLGLISILNSIGYDFFLVLFILQWFLFSFISMSNKDDFQVYKTFSYIFLLLVAIWYVFILRFDQGVIHGTFFMFVLIALILGFTYFVRKKYELQINGTGLIVGGFLLIYSLYTYLAFFILIEELRHIILSILWLIYTLVMYSKIENKEGKYLAGLLLGLTLIKIAFIDLAYLEGAYRIIGFIIFGILLLIGGYFIKNDKK